MLQNIIVSFLFGRKYQISRFLKIYIKASITLRGILLLLLVVLAFQAFPYRYNYRNFNSDDGLTQSYIYSINQDVGGYLWLGTENGLARYNGFRFEIFTTKDSLSDNFVTSSINDGESMWFGHMDGSLTNFNGKKFRAFNLSELNLSAITYFAKSPDGEIWAGTNSDGLIKINKKTGIAKHYVCKNQLSIVSFEFLDNNTLLIGTNTGLLYCRIKEAGEIEIIRKVAEIPESKVTCIQNMRNRRGFYIATENKGVFQLTYKGKQINVSKIIIGNNFNYNNLQYIYEDSKHNLWLATFGNGIVKMNYSTSGKYTNIDYFNKSEGFATDNVKIIFEDREGNIWSGNYGEGLTQITPKIFSIFPFDKPLYGNSVFAIYFNQQYRWIGTEKGLLKMDRITGKMLKFYGKGSGLPNDNITSIYSNNGKELWIGTEKNGLYRMGVKNGSIHKFKLGYGELENSITCITGKGEQLCIGTKKGLWFMDLNTNVKNRYSINQGGLPHNFINSLYLDKSNRLWVSTRSCTLAYIKDEKVYKVPLNPVDGNITLGPITEDADSRIWVGSNGQGVFMIKSDSIANFTVKEGLLSDYCYSIICDDDKNIWVGHKDGLSKIRTTDFSVKPINPFEGKTDNYQFNPNAIIKDQQKKIWFGSYKGIVSYDPTMEYSQLQAPVLDINSIKINDEEKEYTDKIILSPGIYKIKIDYMGISLKEPALVTYQFKLEGFDQWSEITKNTSITYNRLMEGEYKFILKAFSGDGIVSENPLIVYIVIKKPIWKKWWFYFISFLFLTTMAIIYIKRREYIYMTEKKILEEKVRERTFEIQNQKNEIKIQHDIIGRKNASITASIKYASNIQNAILPPLDLFDKLLPDNFILSKPKDIVSGDLYWLAEKDNKIIFTVADCTGHGVPGAFMSLLGITLLNEIVNIQGITKSDDIVTKLRERVICSLQQGRKDITTSDGMDISLCVLDKQKKTIQYTGGMINLIFIHNKTIQIIKGDRLSVCSIYGNSGPFTMKELNYSDGDVIYLFSDGYQDQFGGISNKKYLTRKFFSTLLEIHELPMIEQKEFLLNKLNKWMMDCTQTDDITVMGIRL